VALSFPDRAAYSTRSLSPVHLRTIYNPAAYSTSSWVQIYFKSSINALILGRLRVLSASESSGNLKWPPHRLLPVQVSVASAGGNERPDGPLAAASRSEATVVTVWCHGHSVTFTLETGRGQRGGGMTA
jgi:hypothetical protein